MITKRVFLGIDFPQNLKDKLSVLQEKLIQTNADVKWVDSENFHFCLKFFGQVTEKQLGKISKAVSEVLAEQKKFCVKIAGLGTFPSLNSARVIWVGAEKGSSELISLTQNLDKAFSKEGFEPEKRKFIPHITLGRVRNPDDNSKTKDLLKQNIKDNIPIIIGEFEINELCLYESQLSPKGAKYKKANIFQIH